jgi:hypothetical protein
MGGDLETMDVVSRFVLLGSKEFESTSIYMARVSTVPNQPLIHNYGHGILLRVRAKWVCKAYKLKKLGWLPMLGGFAITP